MILLPLASCTVHFAPLLVSMCDAPISPRRILRCSADENQKDRSYAVWPLVQGEGNRASTPCPAAAIWPLVLLAARCLVLGAARSCLVLGAWRLVLGAWCLVLLGAAGCWVLAA